LQAELAAIEVERLDTRQTLSISPGSTFAGESKDVAQPVVVIQLSRADAGGANDARSMDWDSWDKKGEFVFSLGLNDVAFPLGVAVLRVLDAHATATREGVVIEDELWIRRLSSSRCRSSGGQHFTFEHPERGFLSMHEKDEENNIMFTSHTQQDEVVPPTGEWILSIPAYLDRPFENATPTVREEDRKTITAFTLYLSLTYVMCRSPQCFGPRQTSNTTVAAASVPEVETRSATSEYVVEVSSSPGAGVAVVAVLAGASGMLMLLVFVGKLKKRGPVAEESRKVELAMSDVRCSSSVP